MFDQNPHGTENVSAVLRNKDTAGLRKVRENVLPISVHFSLSVLRAAHASALFGPCAPQIHLLLLARAWCYQSELW